MRLPSEARPRTGDPHVGKGAAGSEVTPTYSSCLAGSGEERHRAALVTAPGSIRLQIWADGRTPHSRWGWDSFGWFSRKIKGRMGEALRSMAHRFYGTGMHTDGCPRPCF